jgi:hypothetical protein
MVFSEVTSDVIYSRANATIISVANLSLPVPITIAPSDLFTALNTIFPNSDSGDIKGAALDYFLDWTMVFWAESDGFTGRQYLRSLLTQPLLLFQPTSGWVSVAANANLEYSVYTELSQSTTRAIIPRWTAILYAVVYVFVWCGCIGALCIALFIQGPATTAFDLIDFSSRIISNQSDKTLARLLSELSAGDAGLIREKLEDKALFVRDVGVSFEGGEEDIYESRRRVGFTSDGEGGFMLEKSQIYE